jgi:hypothetical protein
MTKTPKSRAKTAYGLLSEVCRVILADPRRYNQTDWLTLLDGRARSYWTMPEQRPDCGTIGCVAGWVCAMKCQTENPLLSSSFTYDFARRMLGLSVEQASELFDSDGAGDTRPQTPEHAKAGVKHILRFQRKHAAQLRRTRLV